MNLTLTKYRQVCLSLLSSIILTTNIHAIDYTSIINAIAQEEVNKFRAEFADYNAVVVDTSAAMVAMSNIDFNPDHKGFSAGVGIATLHSNYGDGNAYAVGGMYGFDFGALNIKGAYKGSGEYIFGSGFVVGF